MPRIRRSALKEAREKSGLTVIQLAEKSGVNRRTIVWAEHLAIGPLPKWQAEQLAEALGKPFAKLFPARKKVRSGDHGWQEEYDKILIDDNDGSGTIELTLRGGHQITLSTSGYDYARLYAAVQRHESHGFDFMLFDSSRYQYAVNLKHLVACSFFLGSDNDHRYSIEDDPNNYCKARLWLATSPEMVEFDVSEAVGTPGDPESCAENSLSRVMFDLDGGQYSARVLIIDADEETTSFPVDDVAMFAADRCALYPEMRNAEKELRELADDDRIAEQIGAAKSGGPPKLVVSNDNRAGETEREALTRLIRDAFAALVSSVLLLLAGNGESQDMLSEMLAFERHLIKEGLLRPAHYGTPDRPQDNPLFDLNKNDDHDVLNAILRGSLKQVVNTMIGTNSEQSENALAEMLTGLIGLSGTLIAQRKLSLPDVPD
jgi:transcriptional regulator with XRE-family HTH domain